MPPPNTANQPNRRVEPPFTVADLHSIEWDADRALRAVSQFADDKTRAKLQAACYLLSLMRVVGEMTADGCDPAEVGSRLSGIFVREQA